MTMDEIFKAHLAGQSAGRILDVATGRGGHIDGLIQLFKDYEEAVGIDPFDKGFADARVHFKEERVIFQVMAAESLAFDDAVFDTVAMSNSLHHLDAPLKSLREMARVLKPAGFFLFNEMYCDDQTEEQMTHVLLHHWWAEVDTLAGIPHQATFPRRTMVDMIESLGLTQVEYVDYADLASDPHQKELIDYLTPLCESYPDKIKGKPEYDRHVARGLQLRERLQTVGVRWATQLIVFGRK